MWTSFKTAGLTAVGLLLFAATSHAAAIVSFTTSTRGCFDCTTADLALTETQDGVTFTGTTNQVTATPGGSGTIDLGTFVRSNDNQTDAAIAQFLLEITFTVPSGVNGSPDEFVAVVSANSLAAPMTFNFDNTPVTYSFANALLEGQFTFTIADLIDLNKNETLGLTGAVSNANGTPVDTEPPALVTPEPASLVLFGSGLVGLAARYRRRRQQ